MRTNKKNILAIVTAIIVCIGVGVGIRLSRNNIDNTQTQPTTDSTTSSTINYVVAAMHAASWKDEEFRLDEEVKPEQDSSTGGSLAFSDKNLRSTEDVIAFLQSKSAASLVVIEEAIASIGTTETKLLDIQNWHAVQATVPFTYPKNTSYLNGAMQESGIKRGAAGDIFMIFSDRDTKKMFFLRGACANPVIVIPVPNQNEGTTEESAETTTPFTTETATTSVITSTTVVESTTVTTTKSDSKSGKNKQPGDGDERDSGKGVKPKATTSGPADSTAAKVVESTRSNSGILDWLLKPTGAETGGEAPEVTTYPVGTTRYVPPVEVGANPTTTTRANTTATTSSSSSTSGTSGGINFGDPGAP